MQGELFSNRASNVCYTVQCFISLGFYLHSDKCCLLPAQELFVLGFVAKSLLMTVSITADKKTHLLKLCVQVSKGGPFSIQSHASLVCKLIAAFPSIKFGRLYYRHLKRDKVKALALMAILMLPRTYSGGVII